MIQIFPIISLTFHSLINYVYKSVEIRFCERGVSAILRSLVKYRVNGEGYLMQKKTITLNICSDIFYGKQFQTTY